MSLQAEEAKLLAQQSPWQRLRRASAAWGELRRTPYGSLPVIVLSLSVFFQTLDNSVLTIAGPDIIRELDIDITAIVQMEQLISFGVLFAALGIGWWADRHRRVPLYVAGSAVNGIASMCQTFATSALTLGLPRTTGNVGSRAASVPAASLLADYYPPEARGRVFALQGMAVTTAQVISLPLAGAAITLIGLRATFLSFGLPIVLLAAVSAVVLREPVRGYFERRAMGSDEDVARTEEEPHSFAEAWRTTWAVRTVRRLFFAQMVTALGLGAYFFLGFYLVETYHLTALERGLVGVPGALGALAGAVVGGGLTDMMGRGRPDRVLGVFAMFSAISGVGIAIISLGLPLPVLILGTVLFSFGAALLGLALGAVTTQVVPAAVRAQGMQVFMLSQIPLLLFGLPLYNNVFLHYGYRATFLTAVPFLLLGAIVMATSGGFFELDRRNAVAASVAAHEWRAARAAGEGKLLVCRGVDVAYDGVQVLFGIDFDVAAGEIVALLGTNGAGKSTLLRAVGGIQEASGGAIVFDGRDVTHMPPAEIARRGVITMPGGRGIFPRLSVRDNLLLGGWLTPDEGERARLLAEVYDIFPVLRERATTAAGLLSGGEQQQLSLAQAFLGRPRLLLIDELSLGLSPVVVGELIEKVREIHRRGTTVVVVEQSVNVALTLADRAIFLEKGEVKFVGPTVDLLQRPDILRAVYVKGAAAVGGGPTTSERRRRDDQRDAEPPVLEVRGVSKSYGGIRAVDDVSFTVPRGGVLGVIGPNGSGKTTLFDLISGFQQPDAGRVLLDSLDVTDLAPNERARRKLVRRFQDARLFPSLSVYENLLVALDQRLDTKNVLLGALAAPQVRRAERRLRTRADALVELLGLGAYRDRFVNELSTGLRRIVDLACVLAVSPDLLLLDEPSSGIAQAEAESLAPLLRRVRHETGCTILVIEHDMPLLSRIADEFIALVQGRVVARGTPSEVLDDERVVQAYLGDSAAAIARSGAVTS